MARKASDPDRRSITRRRMMQLAAGSSIAVVAGCSGNTGDKTTEGGDTGGGSDTTTEQKPVDIEFRTFERNWMDTANLNPFSNSRAAGPAWMLLPSLARYSSVATFNGEKEVKYNQFFPMAAKDWQIDGKEMTITIRDDWQWTSGDPVTSDDLALRLRLAKYFGHAIWDHIDEVKKDGDKSVVLSVKGEINPALLEHTLFDTGMQVDTPYKVKGEKTEFTKAWEALEEATSKEERNKITEKLVGYSWTPADNAVLNGPFKATKATKNTLLLSRHDGFYDPVNFTEARMTTMGIGSAGAPQQAVVSEEIDLGPMPNASQREMLPEELQYTVRRGVSGVGFGVNYEKPGGGTIAKRNVRRAIAYLFDLNQVSQNAGPLSTGVADHPYSNLVNAETWIPSDDLGKLETYQKDTAKAASILESEGFTKESGKWKLPNGDPFTLEVNTAPWIFYPRLGQTVVQTLQEFGVQASLNSLGSTKFASTLWGSQNYASSLGVWGGAHPYLAFRTVFGEGNVWNAPAKLEVPKTIGDPNSSLETVDVRKKVQKLQTLKGEEAKQTVTELAWAFNQNLPVIPMVTENWGATYWTDDWEFPSQDSPVWGCHYTKSALNSHGMVNAKR